ncbi:hypothetical protein JZ751_006464 [Albula glossodonta]|uniref:Uncharacterized protein n=1 Tax=Albula glossodonta TaxID=121402 RepID=A0A8T2MU98_9TELE|nr:hypothetical protein JZ751_006464 [Albula glossodonta]
MAGVKKRPGPMVAEIQSAQPCTICTLHTALQWALAVTERPLWTQTSKDPMASSAFPDCNSETVTTPAMFRKRPAA